MIEKVVYVSTRHPYEGGPVAMVGGGGLEVDTQR